MLWIIHGAVMVGSGLSLAFMALRDRSWNGRLGVGVSYLWAACGVVAVICGIVQVVRSWF
jgi:hypothetical protein